MSKWNEEVENFINNGGQVKTVKDSKKSKAKFYKAKPFVKSEMNQALEYLRLNPSSTTSDISKFLNIDINKTNSILSFAERNHKVTAIFKGNTKVWRLINLVKGTE